VVEKLIGLWFNMKEHKTTTLEAQEAFSKVELEVEYLQRVCTILGSQGADNFFFVIKLVFLSSNVVCSLSSFVFSVFFFFQSTHVQFVDIFCNLRLIQNARTLN
jgi:hypothetical protein